MAKRKTITGECLPWKTVLDFLDTLPPWQQLCEDVERRCTVLTEATRRLMAVSVGVCSHNYDFPESLHRLMRMVDAGVARPFRWHGHISPARWKAINTVIVAIQGWLEEKSVVSLSRQYALSQKDLSRYTKLIGADRSHIKRAMLKRLLWNLIDHAVHSTGLGIIGRCEEVPPKEVQYFDFSEAYRLDSGRYYYEFAAQDKPIRDLEDQIQSYGHSGPSFVSYVRTPTLPFCQQKMLRYQQGVLHGIAEKWSDPTARPPGGIPRSQYEAFFNTYADAVTRWYEDLGLPRQSGNMALYEKIFKLLGKRTECKRAILDCLVFRSKSAQDLQEAAFHWLKDHTTKAVT